MGGTRSMQRKVRCIGKPHVTELLVRPACGKWGDNIKTDLEVVTLDRTKWKGVISMVMNRRSHKGLEIS